MKDSKPVTVGILVGLLLTVISVVGFVCIRNPGAFRAENIHSYSVEQVCGFCMEVWLPAGIIGLPMLLVSMIVSMVRESRNNEQ